MLERTSAVSTNILEAAKYSFFLLLLFIFIFVIVIFVYLFIFSTCYLIVFLLFLIFISFVHFIYFYRIVIVSCGKFCILNCLGEALVFRLLILMFPLVVGHLILPICTYMNCV